MQRIIMDCDPGVDDTIAILMALGAGELEIAGITTVGGNVSARQTQANARGILHLAGHAHIPVFAGCSQPLQGGLDRDVLDRLTLIHGASGIAGLTLPDLENEGETGDGVAFIIDTIRSAPARQISIAASGPLTNIATAFIQAPDIIDRLDRIVLMGGAFGNPGGNVKPHAEFNIHADPHAARIVFAQAREIAMIPLDVTHQTLYNRAIRDRIRGIDATLGPNLATMLDLCAANYPGFVDEAPLHDPHIISYLLRPDLYAVERGVVEVFTDEESFGKTELTVAADGNVEVAKAVNGEGFFGLVIGSLQELVDDI